MYIDERLSLLKQGSGKPARNLFFVTISRFTLEMLAKISFWFVTFKGRQIFSATALRGCICYMFCKALKATITFNFNLRGNVHICETYRPARVSTVKNDKLWQTLECIIRFFFFFFFFFEARAFTVITSR